MGTDDDMLAEPLRCAATLGSTELYVEAEPERDVLICLVHEPAESCERRRAGLEDTCALLLLLLVACFGTGGAAESPDAWGGVGVLIIENEWRPARGAALAWLIPDSRDDWDE